jgi:hypothetical protein
MLLPRPAWLSCSDGVRVDAVSKGTNEDEGDLSTGSCIRAHFFGGPDIRPLSGSVCRDSCILSAFDGCIILIRREDVEQGGSQVAQVLLLTGRATAGLVHKQAASFLSSFRASAN